MFITNVQVSLPEEQRNQKVARISFGRHGVNHSSFVWLVCIVYSDLGIVLTGQRLQQSHVHLTKQHSLSLRQG